MRIFMSVLSIFAFSTSISSSFFASENVSYERTEQVNIPSESKRDNDISIDGGDIRFLMATSKMDLTAYTKVKTVSVFQFVYQELVLPDFYAGLGLLDTAPAVWFLHDSTTEWKENWTSSYHTLIEKRNSVGSAELYGWIGYKIEISRNTKIDHLVAKLMFYVSGNYWATNSRPWAEVRTGDILRFVTR